MRKVIISNIAAIAMILMVVSAIAQKEVTKTFKGIKSIKMNTSSGDCKLVKSADATVTVSVRHSYDNDVYDPILEQNGDRLEISEDYHVRSASGGSVRWIITIPEGINIRFKAGSGSLEASGMKLSLDATTGSGDLVFSNASGEIVGNTGSGDVELENYNGSVDLNVGSGSARVNNSKGDLRVSCGSGNIRLSDSNAEFRANTGSGDVIGRNITLAGSSKFGSGSGDTQIALAGSPKFDISVGSGSGNAELNYNGNEIAGEITMMASKSHGSIAAPFEFDKTEEIRAEWGDQTVVKKTVVKGSSAVKVRVSTGSGEASIVK